MIWVGMIAAGIFLYEEPEFKSPNTIEENIVFLECKNSQMDVWVRTSEPIYGIQFEFEGVTLDKSQGGYLDLEGFNTSHNEKMMLAFSSTSFLILLAASSTSNNAMSGPP